MEVKYEESGHTEKLIKDSKEIIISPGIDLRSLIKSKPSLKKKKIISEVEFASRYTNAFIIAVTGTNGKTTTAYLLNSLLGDSSIFVGTIDDDNLFEFTNEKHLTTPKLFNLVKMLSLLDKNITNVVLEVSSHALTQKRLNGLHFKMSGFTNLSQDHLDYHKSMRSYLNAKMLLQVHDELLFEVDQGDVEALISVAKSIMEEASYPAVKLDIPILVDAGHGENWAQAH